MEAREHNSLVSEIANTTILLSQCVEIHQRNKLYMWLFVSVSAVGICGNAFSILLLFNKRRGSAKILSDIYRVYVIALAVADNGMLFFTAFLRYVVVSWLYDPFESDWVYEKHLCRWHRFLMHTSHNAAVWLLVVMACDRFIAVCFPFFYREMKHQSHHAVKITLLVYGFSAVLATPFLAVGPQYHTMKISTLEKIVAQTPGPDACAVNAGICLGKVFNSTPIGNATTELVNPFDCQHPDKKSIINLVREQTSAKSWNGETPLDVGENTTLSVIYGCSLTSSMPEKQAFIVNVFAHIIVSILLPYVVLVVLSFSIVWKLHCGKRMSGNAEERSRVNRRVTIMMLAVCLTFLVFWFPQVYSLMSHVDAHSHNCDKDEVFSSIAELLSLSNSALNFGLYCLTVSNFRAAATASLLNMCACFPGMKTRAESYRTTLRRSNATFASRKGLVRKQLVEMLQTNRTAAECSRKIRLTATRPLHPGGRFNDGDPNPTPV